MNDAAKDNLPRIDAEEILAGIREWVEIETPSHDGKAVNKPGQRRRRASSARSARRPSASPAPTASATS